MKNSKIEISETCKKCLSIKAVLNRLNLAPHQGRARKRSCRAAGIKVAGVPCCYLLGVRPRIRPRYAMLCPLKRAALLALAIKRALLNDSASSLRR